MLSMKNTTQSQKDRLDAAWKKFEARVRGVKSKAKNLLSDMDERKKASNIEEIRKRISKT